MISASFYNAKFCLFVFVQEVLIIQARHNSDTHGLVCLMCDNIDVGLSVGLCLIIRVTSSWNLEVWMGR